MKYGDLSISSDKKSKRVGRGISAGRGKLLVEELKDKAQEAGVGLDRDLKAVRIHYI